MTSVNYKCIYLGLCVFALAASSCSRNEAEPEGQEMVVADQSSTKLEEYQSHSTKNGKTIDQQVSAAVADLAVRAGVEANNITVSQARAVNWASSAVGCPEKGKSYTEAIVPGVLLILEADGVFYRYHGRKGSKSVYCPDSRAEAPAYGPGQELM